MNSDTAPVKAAVLAAGMGKRMRTEGSDLPKVMRLAGGRPLLAYVLDALAFLPKKDITLVLGYGRETVRGEFPDYPFAVQERQLGTGHAARAAMDSLGGFDGDLLVCYGDMPLIRRETYEALISRHRESGASCTILTGTSCVPLESYGRVLRSKDGSFLDIREARDCTARELEIRELNSGVYVFKARPLAEALSKLRPDNSQGEYYLTDVPRIMQAASLPVEALAGELGNEIIGVNTPDQLDVVEEALLARSE